VFFDVFSLKYADFFKESEIFFKKSGFSFKPFDVVYVIKAAKLF